MSGWTTREGGKRSLPWQCRSKIATTTSYQILLRKEHNWCDDNDNSVRDGWRVMRDWACLARWQLSLIMTIMTCFTSSRVSVSASSRHAARGDGWIIVSDFWMNNSRYNGYRERDEVSNSFLRQQPDMPTRINNISKPLIYQIHPWLKSFLAI